MNEQLQINACNEIISKQAVRIRELEQELRNISTAKYSNFDSAEDFRDWAQSRARHTLGEAATLSAYD